MKAAVISVLTALGAAVAATAAKYKSAIIKLFFFQNIS